MAKSDIKRMIELGEWLEIFLDKNINAWGYRQLANNFINLYQVDFEISRNDITLRVLEFVDGKKEYIKAFQDTTIYEKIIKQVGSDYFYEDEDYPLTISDPLKIIQDGYKFDEDNNFPFFFQKFIYAYEKIRNLFLFQKSSKILLEICIGSYKPWGISFFELNPPDVSSNKMLIAEAYAWLSERLSVSPDGVKKNLAFSNDNGLSAPKNSPTAFPWDIAISRVFFDFLFLGGQDYYGFCEWCGNFFVSKRKLKKIYCSDNCRASHRNQINREKAAAKN